MFDNYEDIERTFEVTVADNGFVLKLSAKQRNEEDSWASDYSFVFGNLEQLTAAIDALSEVV
jgi:hypothetical protein